MQGFQGVMDALRFDVETLIIATKSKALRGPLWLRFDVETLIIATQEQGNHRKMSCGLM